MDDYSGYNEITEKTSAIDVDFIGLASPTTKIADFSFTIYDSAKTERGSLFTIDPSTYANEYDLVHTIVQSDGTAAPSWVSFNVDSTGFDLIVESSDPSIASYHYFKIYATMTHKTRGDVHSEYDEIRI